MPILSVDTDNGVLLNRSCMKVSVDRRRFCRMLDDGSGVAPRACAETNVTKFVGQPKGMSTPITRDGGPAAKSSIWASETFRATASTVTEASSHSISQSAVFFGSAARSIPRVRINLPVQEQLCGVPANHGRGCIRVDADDIRHDRGVSHTKSFQATHA